jgi:hypothetical protein
MEHDNTDLPKLLKQCPRKGTLFRHYKGGLYIIVGSALNENTREPMVLYTRSGDHLVWSRPLSNFVSLVQGDTARPRFEQLTDEYGVSYVAVEDKNTLVALVAFDTLVDQHKLWGQFEALFDPGPNPRAFDTAVQDEWLRRVKDRENRLVALYGGTRTALSGEIFYGLETFVNWLVKERGGRRVPFRRLYKEM